MTRKLNVAAQLIACAGHMLIPASPVDSEMKEFLHAVVAYAQAAVGIIAHNYTPEGNKL